MSYLLVQIRDRLLDVYRLCYLVLGQFCDSWKLRRQYLFIFISTNQMRFRTEQKNKKTTDFIGLKNNVKTEQTCARLVKKKKKKFN